MTSSILNEEGRQDLLRHSALAISSALWVIGPSCFVISSLMIFVASSKLPSEIHLIVLDRYN